MGSQNGFQPLPISAEAQQWRWALLIFSSLPADAPDARAVNAVVLACAKARQWRQAGEARGGKARVFCLVNKYIKTIAKLDDDKSFFPPDS